MTTATTIKDTDTTNAVVVARLVNLVVVTAMRGWILVLVVDWFTPFWPPTYLHACGLVLAARVLISRMGPEFHVQPPLRKDMPAWVVVLGSVFAHLLALCILWGLAHA